MAIVVTTAIGVILFAWSLTQPNIPVAFMGLGLTVWGVSLIFVTSTKMVRASLVASQMSDLTLTLDKLLEDMGYDGDSYISPPSSLGGAPSQIIESRDQASHKFVIVPSGLHLASLLEREANADFASVDLKQLEDLLVKVIVEKLELSGDFQMLQENNKVHVRMRDFAFREFYKFLGQTTHKTVRIACPTVTALACTLAKATKKKVHIERIALSGGDLNCFFRLE